MADNPQQAEVRRNLAARGNQLAPRAGQASGTLAVRQQRAERRKSVVAGAVGGAKAGPAGAATGAASGAVNARKASASTASTRASSTASVRPARTRRKARGGSGFKVKGLEGPHTGALFAEYFGGALVISLELFTQGATRGYMNSISRVMMRLTALTAVFFVLFLMQGSRRGGQAAIWLGLLIDLGIIFTAARGQTLSTTADIISGKGTGIQLTAVESGLDAPPQPEGVKLPDE